MRTNLVVGDVLILRRTCPRDYVYVVVGISNNTVTMHRVLIDRASIESFSFLLTREHWESVGWEFL